MTAVLEFRDTLLRYGHVEAVNLPALTVAAGQVVGLVGPNGAGKTSIARLATGFALPSSGVVTVNGMPARAYRRSHGVGYVAEELPRIGHCTVGALLDVRRADIAQNGSAHADRVLELTAVAPLLRRRVLELSKGQWRSVLLAYSVLSRPGLVVLDEPESGLDPNALDRLSDLIAFIGSTGAVVMILSHQLFEVERTCHRVLFIRHGSVVAEEAASQGGAFLRSRYKEVFA